VGRPEEVYENPATEFVAGFLGASNLLDGEVRERGASMSTVVLAGGSAVLVPTGRLDGAESRVKVGVRPEKIRIERDEGTAPPDHNSVTGTLRVVAYVGVSHQYEVDGPEGSTLTVYEQNLRATPGPGPGERVRLVWRPEHTFAVRASGAPAEEEEQ
jgi:spermidine/putrescine transport system ATP-binding protein